MTSSPHRPHKAHIEKNPYSISTQDAMLIQDGYCSPERPSYKGSSKQTPKSILKEYNTNSGSKSKKGILINETLNETRKLSMRSESSEVSGARNRNRPQSAANTSLASFEAQVRGSNQKNNENDRYKSDSKKGFSSLWTPQAFNTGIRSDSTQELSDFQKAYVKKLQRDREQEIYCEVVRRSNASLDQGNKAQNEVENNRQSSAYEDNRQLLRNIEQKRQSLDQGISKRSQESLSSLGYVEEKIQQLEKCLDVYSNRLRDSIIRQRDQLIAGHYKKTGTLPDNIPPRSWDDKGSSYKTQEGESEWTSSKRSNVNEHKKSKDDSVNQGSYGNTYASGNWEEGLQQLKEENRGLRSKLPNQTAENYGSTKKKGEEYNSNNVYDKEMELLKTVEDIRTKLYNSLAKRSIEQRDNQSKTTTLSKSDYKRTTKSKVPRANKSSKSTKEKNADVEPKYLKVRKAYGEEVLERENACILNQGLSTSYSGFHWNADNSLKITRNI